MSQVLKSSPESSQHASEREKISALVDGQLLADEFEQVLSACEHDPQLKVCWSDFHLIGEVLRSPALEASAYDPAFVARLQQRLSAESPPAALAVSPVVAQTMQRTAANDSVFRRKLMAGMATLAAVAAVSWITLGIGTQPQVSELAQAAPEQVLVASPQGIMVRDARLEELLAAHKQFGGTSALQMPSGFLRNATFETHHSEKR